MNRAYPTVGFVRDQLPLFQSRGGGPFDSKARAFDNVSLQTVRLDRWQNPGIGHDGTI
jgi:hypothetical protein